MALLPVLVWFSLLLHFVGAAKGGDGSSSFEFILGEPTEFARTPAGGLWYLEGSSLKELDVALGYTVLEPGALLLPHYIDSSLVLYVQKGEAVIGCVREKTVKKELKAGDVYSVAAGTVMYVINTSQEDKLCMLGMFDTRSAMSKGRFEPFFVGGGVDPKITLAGFSSEVLESAFGVPKEQIKNILDSQAGGPIIRTAVSQEDMKASPWSIILESELNKHKEHKKDKKHKQDHKKKHDDKKHKKDDDREKEDDKKKPEDGKDGKQSKAFNLFEKRVFENDHGWIASTTGQKIQALKNQRVQVSAFNLKPGSLLAPHWSSQGSEFGVVTNGSGVLQISYSNGTNAADEKISKDTVFFVPQFLPACQVAAVDEALEFIVFTISSEHHRSPSKNAGLQFLAGRSSVLKSLDLGTLALAFDVPDQLLSSFLGAQTEAAILPAFHRT